MKLRLFILGLSFVVMSCSSLNDSSQNAPEGHTISKGGVMHKPGLNNAPENCVSCHGSDLNGGDVGVSCYKCHGKKWSG